MGRSRSSARCATASRATRCSRILGIVNGTTNYILDLMDTEGASLEDALAKATELGYAEADPTADIGGYDAAQKAAILASLAFHTTVPLESVYREGITEVTLEQVRRRAQGGLRRQAPRRLRADRRRRYRRSEGVSARVHPALMPASHPLAAVHGAKNAVFVEAEAAGNLMFYGAGAGGMETASAVLGDLVSAARRHVDRRPRRRRVDARQPADAADLERHDPLPDHARPWSTSPACSRRSRRCSASTASRSRPSSRIGGRRGRQDGLPPPLPL